MLWTRCIYAKPCDFCFLFVSIFFISCLNKAFIDYPEWCCHLQCDLLLKGRGVKELFLFLLKLKIMWERKNCNSSLDSVRMMIPHERYQRICIVSHTAGVYAKHLTDVDMAMTAFPLISYVQLQMKVGLPSHSTSWIPNLFFCFIYENCRRGSSFEEVFGPKDFLRSIFF